MTLKSDLEALAKDIRVRAALSATPFAEAVDALKALTHLYATFQKDKGKNPDEESDGFTMADARDMIGEESGHGSTVRGRRGSGPAGGGQASN